MVVCFIVISKELPLGFSLDQFSLVQFIKKLFVFLIVVCVLIQVIYTWGSGWESKLGHGDRENLAEPTKIQTNFQFKSISAGYHHSAALTQEDQLVVWGPYRYFGHIRPDENVKDKKAATSNQFEYSEFMKPTLHPKITEKIRFVSLGDKLSIIVTKKDNKII